MSPNAGRLLLFAMGDFAFNLFWQSAMLFLLYYYTDVLGIPIAAAAIIFAIGAVWDGVANFAAGLVLDRRPGVDRSAALRLGALPLGLAFACTYLPAPGDGAERFVSLLVAHLLFRTLYAAINVPYLTMSARITVDSGDRAVIAGARMLFGTAAAVVVALGTVPIGSWFSGTPHGSQAFLWAAGVFAAVGAAILMVVGYSFRESAAGHAPAPTSVREAVASLVRNRAFLSLVAAMTAMVVAATVLNKSVLYYFKYALGDPGGGQLALASMAMTSAIAVPCWMLIARRLGLRAAWLVAALGATLSVLAFASGGLDSSSSMQMFLVTTQAMIMGLNFVFWAMLPNTIEYGDRATGVHVEGIVFGLAALLQRLAIGLGTALLGWTLGSAGYVANVAQEPEAIEAMRWTVAVTPLVFLALSCAAMLANPLARGVHRKVVEQLQKGRTGADSL